MSDEHVNEHKSAFPWVSNGDVHEHQAVEYGITKREYFAALAMQGDFASQDNELGVFDNEMTDWEIELRVKLFFRFADAMIKESENGR